MGLLRILCSAGMTIFGGLTPLAMTGMALISIVSSQLLIKCYPLTNQRGSI